MTFDRDLLLEAVRICNRGELHLTTPPAHYEKWIMDRSLPEDLAGFLRATAFSTAMEIGHATLHEFRRIRSWDHNFPAFINQGLIAVGASRDGDPILIDFENGGGTGYLSHDKPYYDPKADLRGMFTPMSVSIGQFALASAHTSS